MSASRGLTSPEVIRCCQPPSGATSNPTSFASHLVMRGATMTAVQELLAHATIVMTMRYAHLAPEVIRETVRLLDGVGREWAEKSKAAAK